MRIDGIHLREGSDFSNLKVAMGADFPESSVTGELFFRTHLDPAQQGLFVFIGGNWTPATSMYKPDTDVLAIERVPLHGVKQFETVLTIFESQILDDNLLARVREDEVVTGSWVFNTPIMVPTPHDDFHAATKRYVDEEFQELRARLAALEGK